MEDYQSEFSVVIADDQTLIRHTIKNILDACANYEVIGEATSPEDIFELLKILQPDILILDSVLGNKSCLEIIKELKEKHLPASILVILESPLNTQEILQAGAMAVLSADKIEEDLIKYMNLILTGEKIYSSPCSEQVNESSDLLKSAAKKLSKREQEVYDLLLDGLSLRAISKKLFISPRTVETHATRVAKKLGLDSISKLREKK